MKQDVLKGLQEAAKDAYLCVTKISIFHVSIKSIVCIMCHKSFFCIEIRLIKSSKRAYWSYYCLTPFMKDW
jgi:hypothetical protein